LAGAAAIFARDQVQVVGMLGSFGLAALHLGVSVLEISLPGESHLAIGDFWMGQAIRGNESPRDRRAAIAWELLKSDSQRRHGDLVQGHPEFCGAVIELRE
jgi:hypothetical protein